MITTTTSQPRPQSPRAQCCRCNLGWPNGEPTATAATSTACHLIDLADADTTDDPLDDYVEAHVHGGVHLPGDVEALVLDPCYRGTPVEDDAHRLGVPVELHHGFRVTTAQIAAHPDYRGLDVVAAAARIARDDVVDARVIGDAARAGLADPQTLKRVWHCTARYGRPADA